MSAKKPGNPRLAPRPAKKSSKPVGKESLVGSPRREAKAATKTRNAGRRTAQGVGADPHTHRLETRIHAKKDPPVRRGSGGRKGSGGSGGPGGSSGAGRSANGKVAVGTPNVPGYSMNVDAAKYGAMKDILLKVLPRKSPGLTQGEMFDAVREAASNGQFPGSTHRWWAKCVQLDLEAKGALVRAQASPARWHLR